MHNDYGWAVRDEAGREFKGLRQLFTARSGVRRHARRGDLARTAAARSTACCASAWSRSSRKTSRLLAGLLGAERRAGRARCTILRRRLGTGLDRPAAERRRGRGAGRRWWRTSASSAVHAGRHPAQVRVVPPALGFLQYPAPAKDPVEDIFASARPGAPAWCSNSAGYGNTLEAYMLVANYLTRRIHERYVRAQEPRRRAGRPTSRSRW